ncbi:MAG: hypothetical protein ACE5SW_00935 [Nitrososphaeraceae archaeon]
MEFSELLNDLRYNLKQNENAIQNLTKKNANLAFFKINEIANFVGKRHGVHLQLHFPDTKKILEFESYGNQNIGIVLDKFRKKFIIPRNLIKDEAKKQIPEASVLDAYMYEDKEGLRIVLKTGRIEVLPGSVHIWCKIDQDIERFMNWLFKFVIK